MRKHPPVVSSPGLLGGIPDLQKDLLGFFKRCFQECGDIGRIRFGPFHAYIVFHPDLVKEILQKQSENYLREGPGYKNLRLVLNRGLLTSDGTCWHQQRQQVMKFFSPKYIATLVPLINTAVTRRLKEWGPLYENDSGFDMHEEMAEMTLSVFDQCYLHGLLGRDIRRIRQSHKFFYDFIWERITKVVPAPLWFPTPNNRLYRYHQKERFQVISNLVENYEKNPGSKESFLSAILDNTSRTRAGKIDLNEASGKLCTFINSGHDTLATMLSWTWYLLSQHPEVERKVRQEVHSVIGDRTPAAEDLDRLVYMEQVFKESLRLYTPIWHFSKRSVRASSVGGYDIPARTTVILCQFCTHRHPEFWDEPEEFRPERFTTEKVRQMHPFAFFPFGGGPHHCVGQALSFIQAKIILTQIIRKYDVNLSGGGSVDVDPKFELHPKGSLQMNIKRRI